MFTKKLFHHRSENSGKPAARRREHGFLRSDFQVAVLVCGIGVLFLVRTSGRAATMVWETNNFDGGAGNWIITQNDTANGNNVGWLNSSRAGGTAGELGGSFARSTTTAFYGRLLDFTVTLNDPLHMRGVFSATNTALNWNGSISIGYFNTAEATSETLANYVVWKTREPNIGGVNNYRARARVNGANAQLNSPSLTYVQGQSYTFDVEWIPSGNNDGSGTFQGNIGGLGPPTGTNFWTFTQVLGAQSLGPGFDAFGLWWDESGNEGFIQDVYFDNMEYLVPVPEPSTGLLAGLGIVGLWLGNRVRRGRRE